MRPLDRVVWWVNQYAVPPTSSGGTRHFDMAAELRREGWDVRIVASDFELHSRRYRVRRSARDVRASTEVVAGVPFVWLPAGSYRENDWRRVASMLTFSVATFVYLVRTRGGRAAIVIGSSPHLFGAAAAWLAARVRRRRFVLEVRDLWPESYVAVSGRDGGVQVRVMAILARLLYRHSDAVIVLADANASVIIEAGASPHDVHFIPNGVDLAAFEGCEPPTYHGGPVRFVYTGAHGPANGLDVLIRAAASLARSNPDLVEVTLIGDGPAKDELQALALSVRADNVSFSEPIPKSAIPSALAAHHVGLMVLADHELFQTGVSPNKLYDYLAAGLHVLTNVAGIATTVVEESGAGLACGPGVEALAQAMATLAADVRSGTAAAGDGRAYVSRSFDRRELASRLSDVLDRVGLPV